MPEKCESLEELRWAPGVPDCDLMMYLRAARSMAAFAGMCDGGSAEDGCLAASRDDTTINALELLHESSYDTGKALQALVKNPIPKGIEKKWADEEQKRFVKGLRQYGKNFFKIRRELLSHKDTADLVEFYYLWKKTPQAATTRPHRRHRRQCVLRRIRATSSSAVGAVVGKSVTPSNEYLDMSSASEEEESDDSDSRDANQIANASCNHCCTTNSKEWHQSGKDRSTLCTECHVFYKKFGEFRPLPENRDMQSQFIFKPVKDEDNNNVSISNGARRTRRGKDIGKGNAKIMEPLSPERNDPLNSKISVKSPDNNFDINSNDNNENKDLDLSPNPKKRSHEDIKSINNEMDETSDLQPCKKKAANDDGSSSPSESVSTENSFPCNDDNAVAEHDNEEANGNVSAPHSPQSSRSLGSANEEQQIQSDIKVEDNNYNPLNNVPLTDAEEEKVVPNDNPIIHSSIEQNYHPVLPPPPAPPPLPPPSLCPVLSKSPTQLITPKLEPPSSPPSLDFSSSLNHMNRAPESNCLVPSNEPSIESSPPPPIKIKEEAPSKSPPLQANAMGSVRMQSPPIQNQMFPFYSQPESSQSLENNTNRLPTPPIVQQSIENIQCDMNKGVINQRDFIQKSPKERRSLSPKHNASPITSVHPLNVGTPVSSSIASPTDMPLFHPSYSSFPPSEQRLPPVPPHNPHISSGIPPPPPPTNLSPHFPLPQMLPPVMHFSSPWPAYTPRLQSHPLGFHSSSFQPPSLNPNGQQLQSPHYPLVKSKSPVITQSSHSSPSGVSQHSTVQSHFSQSSKNEHNKYDMHMGQNRESNRDHHREHHREHRDHRDHRDNRDHRDHREHREHLPPQEEDEIEQSPVISRGPSPEPKIEDSECHRSQSAIFLRHWNRGDFNSCARTDLTFKPVPDSQLARKREERARKAAEKEREEQKKIAAEKGLQLDIKSGMMGHGSMDNVHHMSPLGRHTPRSYPDTPALRQLSEYARPHAAFSPVYPNPSMSVPSMGGLPLGLQSQTHIDQFLQYHMDPMQMMSKQRELKEKEMELKRMTHSNQQSGAGLFDPHWLELQRRYSAGMHGAPQGPPPPPGLLQGSAGTSGFTPPFMFYNSNERPNPEQLQQLHGLSAVERLHNERLAISGTDPLFRLQMAGITPELHNHAHNHAHAHQHTHLHVHPSHDPVTAAAAAAAAAIGIPTSQHNSAQFDPTLHSNHPLMQSNPYGQRPQSLMQRNELSSAALFRPQFEEQLVHQLSAQAMHHEQLQRQLFMERERMVAAQLSAAANSQLSGPLPPQFLSPHEIEFLRQQQQRERELKLRSLEDAARGGRPPLS